MVKTIGLFAGGLIVGRILVGIIGWTIMPGMMLTVHKSKLGFIVLIKLGGKFNV